MWGDVQCDFASLSLEIQLFFFPFLFPRYCCSVFPYVVSEVIGHCNKSSFFFFLSFYYSLEERIQLWKQQHFENSLRNPPKVTHQLNTWIISKQLNIKVGPFTQEKFDSELKKKIKNRKAAGLDEIPPEVWKTREFDTVIPYIIKTQLTKGQMDSSFHSLKMSTSD